MARSFKIKTNNDKTATDNLSWTVGLAEFTAALRIAVSNPFDLGRKPQFDMQPELSCGEAWENDQLGGHRKTTPS